MPPNYGAFGNELIVGLRRTREFGTAISADLGGMDSFDGHVPAALPSLLRDVAARSEKPLVGVVDGGASCSSLIAKLL